MGVTTAVENDAFEFLERCHRANMEAIGGRAKSQAFFELVPRYFRPDDEFAVYVARHRGEPIAALLLFYFGKTVEYFVPAVVAAYRGLQGLPLLVFRAVSDAVARGMKLWNWGGTWHTQDGIYRFKRKWAARDLPYHYYTKVRNPAVLGASRCELAAAYPNFYVVPYSALRQ